jgi:hypothetical protein
VHPQPGSRIRDRVPVPVTPPPAWSTFSGDGPQMGRRNVRNQPQHSGRFSFPRSAKWRQTAVFAHTAGRFRTRQPPPRLTLNQRIAGSRPAAPTTPLSSPAPCAGLCFVSRGASAIAVSEGASDSGDERALRSIVPNAQESGGPLAQGLRAEARRGETLSRGRVRCALRGRLRQRMAPWPAQRPRGWSGSCRRQAKAPAKPPRVGAPASP